MNEQPMRFTIVRALMLLAGCIFGFMHQWIYAALVCVSALGCFAAALNFKNRKDKQKHDD